MSDRISPQDEARVAENTRRLQEQVPEMKATPWDLDTYRGQYDALIERAKTLFTTLETRDAELDVLREELQRLRAAVEYAANPSVAHPDNSAADITVWVDSFADDRTVRAALNACIRLARHALSARGVIGEEPNE